MPAAKKMAAAIAGNAPIAVRACKKAINEGLQVSIDEGAAIEEELFGSCFESYDQQEGMANFLRKKDDPKKVKKVAFKNEYPGTIWGWGCQYLRGNDNTGSVQIANIICN